jgi:GNAT superfamily N-acetyltransferase
MNYTELFDQLHPDFFQDAGISSLPQDEVYTELVIDLRYPVPCASPLPCPAGITFGDYHGDLDTLHAAVAQVDEDWVQYFNEGDRVFGAFSGDQLVAFCSLEEMGRPQNLRISGPGCVGTIPAFRKQGIGLEMVRRATLLLKEEGYDLSWIHYTHLADWYSKLGYRPVLRWNSGGLLPEETNP